MAYGWRHLLSCSDDKMHTPLLYVLPLLTKQQGSVILHPALEPLSPNTVSNGQDS